jgi:hypothetical protein
MAGSAGPTLSRQADDKKIYHGRRDALRFPALRAQFVTLNYYQGQSSHPFWKFLSFCLTLAIAVFGNKAFADPAGGRISGT